MDTFVMAVGLLGGVSPERGASLRPRPLEGLPGALGASSQRATRPTAGRRLESRPPAAVGNGALLPSWLPAAVRPTPAHPERGTGWGAAAPCARGPRTSQEPGQNRSCGRKAQGRGAVGGRVAEPPTPCTQPTGTGAPHGGGRWGSPGFRPHRPDSPPPVWPQHPRDSQNTPHVHLGQGLPHSQAGCRPGAPRPGPAAGTEEPRHARLALCLWGRRDPAGPPAAARPEPPAG